MDSAHFFNSLMLLKKWAEMSHFVPRRLCGLCISVMDVLFCHVSYNGGFGAACFAQ